MCSPDDRQFISREFACRLQDERVLSLALVVRNDA